MNNKKTELKLADSGMTNGEGAYIEYHYSGIRDGSWIRLDAGAVIKANQQAWLKSIEDWHRELCIWGSKKSKYWWLNNASRLTVWVPFDLRPLLYARAVLEMCATQEYSRIYLFEMPKEVIAYLIEWEGNGFANYKLVGAQKNTKHKVSVMSVLARTSLQLAKLILVWIASIRPVSRNARSVDLLVYSSPLASQTVASQGDHYFGRVLDGVNSSRIKLEWLYESRGFSDLGVIKKALHDTGREFHFALGQLKIQDVFMVIIGVMRELAKLKSIANNMPIITIGAMPCVGFSANFARHVIFTIPPVWEIALLYAFRRYLKIVKPKSVIYPYEEKGGERALILACEATTPKVLTIAFAHAVHGRGHLYVHNSQEGLRPTPCYLAVTGIAAKDWFSSWGGVPIDRIRVVGSPRYIADGGLPPEPQHCGEQRRLLFLCGIGHEISRLVNFATTTPDVFAHSILRIRKYPYSWQEQQDEDISKLKKCGIQVLVEKQDLDKEIAWADVVLFTTTSASLAAMHRNKPCIRIVDDVLDTSPLAGRDQDTVVPNCRSAEDLRNHLDRLFSLNKSEYRLVVEAQRSLAVDIFSKWDNESLGEMINLPMVG